MRYGRCWIRVLTLNVKATLTGSLGPRCSVELRWDECHQVMLR